MEQGPGCICIPAPVYLWISAAATATVVFIGTVAATVVAAPAPSEEDDDENDDPEVVAAKVVIASHVKNLLKSDFNSYYVGNATSVTDQIKTLRISHGASDHIMIVRCIKMVLG